MVALTSETSKNTTQNINSVHLHFNQSALFYSNSPLKGAKSNMAAGFCVSRSPICIQNMAAKERVQG